MVRGWPVKEEGVVLAREATKERMPIIVEEKRIGTAAIARPGTIPSPGGGVSLDTHMLVKSEIDKAASRGMCPSIDEISMTVGMEPNTVSEHLKILETDEYGAMCSLERFCSHNACKSMLDKIHRWRGEA